MGLMLLGGCAFRSGSKSVSFVSQDQQVFHFSDRALQVDIFVNEPQFAYEFRNHRYTTMVIEHRDVELIVDDAMVTLWGEPIGDETALLAEIPPIRVRPGRFVRLEYPVRFRSPLRPFNVGKNHYRLRFTAHWEDGWREYELALSRKPQPIAERSRDPQRGLQ